MNKNFLFATLAVAAVMMPVSAFAASTTAAYQAKSNTRIAADEVWFNREISVINAKKNITADRKAFLVNIAKGDIAIFDQMKTDISNVSDLSTAKKDYNSIQTMYSALKSGLKSILSA